MEKNKQTVLVSIIIPLYNKEQSIFNTIQSVLSQSYKNIELIVIDDGSTDESVKVVSSIEDTRITLIRQTNHGVAYTRNRGVKESKGDYVLFLDADDYLYQMGIESLLSFLNIFPNCEVVTGNYYTKSRKYKKKSCTLNKDQVLTNPFRYLWYNTWDIRLGSFIINRNSLISKVPYFDPNILIGEDVIFTDNIIQVCTVGYVPCNILDYNRNFSILSEKEVNIEKTYEWNIAFNNEINIYLKRIYYDKIFRKIIKSILKLNLLFSIKLITKYWKVSYKILFFFFKRRIENIYFPFTH